MSRKHSSWKDNEIVYCHPLTRNLASVSVRQLWTNPPVEVVSSFFPLLMLLNCPPNMCSTLNPLDQLHKKWILRNVLKTSLVYCSLNSARSYTLKYLNNGSSIPNYIMITPSAKSFTGGQNASKPVSHYQNYEAYQASPPKKKTTKNVTIPT